MTDAEVAEIQKRIDALAALKLELEVARTNELLKLAGRGTSWVPDGVNLERAQSLHATIAIIDEASRSEGKRIPFMHGVI